MRFVAVLGAIHDQTTLAASLGACAATAAALVAVLLECVSIQSLQEHRNRSIHRCKIQEPNLFWTADPECAACLATLRICQSVHDAAGELYEA